jgi:hypothetical protein
MPISAALEKSAKAFCSKYACSFDFNAFEATVEDFTFLRPVSGWIDAYKSVFEKLYMQAIAPITVSGDAHLDGEAMLDDFEYTLIRPYVNESSRELDHKPYLGMDRVSRIEYLQQLTKRSPSNFVDLCAEKYKDGRLSIKQMQSKLESEIDDGERYTEIVGCIRALETVNKSRSLLWRAFHPIKNEAEKRSSERMKRVFFDLTDDSEETYSEIVNIACKTFGGYEALSAKLEQNMMCAREEMSRKQKMNDAMRESLGI